MYALSLLICLGVIACAPSGQTTVHAPTAKPTATSTSPTTTASPPPTLPGWKLIWDDEFNGSSVDTSRWTVVSSLPGGFIDCCLAYGYASWAPDHVSESGGHLVLHSTDDPLAGKPYSSGAVTTAQTFSFMYGRIDVRARLPRTTGLWPAAWLLPVQGDSPGYAPNEIDLMEAWGANTNEVFAFFHWHSTQQVTCRAFGADFAAGFHDFTLIWTPNRLEWQVDGVTKCVSTAYVPQTPMYLNLSTAVGGRFQPTDSATRLPQTTEYSYVRVWTPA